MSTARRTSGRSAQQSDQPVLSNFSLVNVAPGMALIDFGFIEPLAALPRMALSGGKMPERQEGQLKPGR
jgi:hypothetical protein